MKNKLLLFIVGVLLVTVGYIIQNRIFGKPPANTREVNKVKVVTSMYPLYFFTTQIGGELVDVTNITPAGTEPHDFEPTSKHIVEIEKSDLLIINGNVEAWADKIKENFKNSDIILVTATDGLSTQQVEGEGQEQSDPHVWLDPVLAKKEVKAITDALIKADPKNVGYFNNNEKILNAKLDQLDNAFKNGLSTCQKQDIITSHSAFGYLASRYNLKQVAITGLSPDAEPSTRQLSDIAKFAKARNVDYIFFETLISPKLSQTLADEIGAKTLVLDPLEGLTGDQIKAGKDYFSQMHENLNNLKIALACT